MNRLILLGILSLASLSAGGSDAIQQASSANSPIFIFFYKEQNEKTDKLQAVFDQALQKMGSQVRAVKVNITDPAEKGLVDRFNLKRSPMPFVIALAPNGAITGGFPSFTEEQLVDALTSVGASKCIKALQDKKLVILALQNSQTTQNEAALKGARDFKADGRFANATEIVTIDPQDANEQKFLNQLGANLQSSEAVTLLISPPAEIIGKYTGATDKNQMVSDLEKATSGCCCPGGCCPGGKCCPK